MMSVVSIKLIMYNDDECRQHWRMFQCYTAY